MRYPIQVFRWKQSVMRANPLGVRPTPDLSLWTQKITTAKQTAGF